MEVFNPNPTVFITSKLHKAAQFAKPHSLWLEEQDSYLEQEYEDDENEVEAIDQDEIFGRLARQRCFDSPYMVIVQTSSGQYQTQNIGA